MKKANYGQELIPVIRILTVIIVLIIGVNIYLHFSGTENYTLMHVLSGIAVFFAFLIGMSLWSSRVGKLIMRDRLIDELNLTGSENVLDVGCGKGLIAVGVAKKLTSGKVTGLDHWKGTFEYSYTHEMMGKNVAIEGMEQRVDIVDGDAKQLPFEKNTFDIITSSLAMHHVGDGNLAFREMMRVLKPAGIIAIADMPTKQIKRQMQEEGFEITLIKPLVRLFFIKVHLIIAKKK